LQDIGNRLFLHPHLLTPGILLYPGKGQQILNNGVQTRGLPANDFDKIPG